MGRQAGQHSPGLGTCWLPGGQAGHLAGLQSTFPSLQEQLVQESTRQESPWAYTVPLCVQDGRAPAALQAGARLQVTVKEEEQEQVVQGFGAKLWPEE